MTLPPSFIFTGDAMRRKEYLVTIGNSSWVKYSWNSAIKSIDLNIKQRAELFSTTYELVASESVKDGERFDHGERVWYSASHGEKRRYLIRRVQ